MQNLEYAQNPSNEARPPECVNCHSARNALQIRSTKEAVAAGGQSRGCAMMTEEPWPYNLPIFRRSCCAHSPDGHRTAQINPATEKGMSNPTSGTLCVTGGPHVENCNPSFIWSDDSRYLVVPQFHGVFKRQRILIVAFELKRIYMSNQKERYFQPESFSQGQLVVRLNPASKSTRLISFTIPSDLSTQFCVLSRVWPAEE